MHHPSMLRLTATYVPLLVAPQLFTAHLTAQAAGFAAQAVITTAGDRPTDVHVADLDGDGDLDVLSSSTLDDKIGWCENLGGGVFGTQQVLATMANAQGVDAADLDGDGDLDVLSISDGTVAWQRNLGAGVFAAPATISTAVNSPWAVRSADLDGDGDVDVLSVSLSDDKLAWYPNLGGGAFGPQRVISTAGSGPVDLRAADLDGDGDDDVVVASFLDDELAWFENTGSGTFGPQRMISTAATTLSGIDTADLDGDGDLDVLAASTGDATTAWHENLGGGAFGPRRVISQRVAGTRKVASADFDNDGDLDVVAIGSASFDPLAWFENLGGGSFGPVQPIIIGNSAGQRAGADVVAADLDGDGLDDVVTAATQDDKIAWYANWATVSTFGIGCGAANLTLSPTSEAVVGAPMTGLVVHSPSSTCVVALGFSRTNAAAFGALPFPLATVGMTGCTLYHSSELFGLATQPGPVPFLETLWTGPTPPPGTQGLRVYGQAFSLAPGANPAGAVSSNAVEWLIR